MKKLTVIEMNRLQKDFKPLSERQIAYAQKNCFNPVACESRNRMMCTVCGKTWKVKNGKDIEHTECPHCKAKLGSVVHHTLRNFQTDYFCTTSAIQGRQVIRYFLFRRTVSPGNITYSHDEIGSRWIDGNGKGYDFDRSRIGMFYNQYTDGWNLDSEIRHHKRNSGYYGSSSLLADIHPGALWFHSMLPTLKRNGWDGKLLFYNISDVVSSLLSNPVFESFYKQRQFGICAGIIKEYSYSHNIADSEWMASVKIAIRHGKKFNTLDDWKDFVDYLNDMRFLDMDMRNPKYLVPEDFQSAHQKLAEKATRIRAERHAREERERMLKRAKADARKAVWMNEYAAKFADMVLNRDNFTIRPLITTEDFQAESDEMHHCIATYYGKVDTLLISIEYKGDKTETAEINLVTNKIIQCRGHCNQSSEYHSAIMDFIKSSLKEFQNRYKKNIDQPTPNVPAVIMPAVTMRVA